MTPSDWLALISLLLACGSFVYTHLKFRQESRLDSRSAYAQIHDKTERLLFATVDDPEVRHAFFAHKQGEKAKIDVFCQAWINHFLEIYHMLEDELFDEDSIRAMKEDMRLFLKIEALRTFWQGNRELQTGEFRAFIDGLVESSDRGS